MHDPGGSTKFSASARQSDGYRKLTPPSNVLANDGIFSRPGDVVGVIVVYLARVPEVPILCTDNRVMPQRIPAISFLVDRIDFLCYILPALDINLTRRIFEYLRETCMDMLRRTWKRLVKKHMAKPVSSYGNA